MSSGGANPLVQSWRKRRESPPPRILRALNGRELTGGLVRPGDVIVHEPRSVRRRAARDARRAR